MAWLFTRLFYALTVPVASLVILNSRALRPEYGMTWPRKLWLGWRFFINQLRIPTASSYKSHLAMTLKLLELPPGLEGVVVECGTWKGGSAANLSLACRIVGRRLVVFDSFEGLPEGEELDREALEYKRGDYAGSLEEVKANIARGGAIEVCDFRRGWFNETLPAFEQPIVLVYLDVDLEASLHTCLVNLWPRVVDEGYIFTDEFVSLDYCSVFFSEAYWRRYFDREPPGLLGVGIGLALGEYYIGPHTNRREMYPLQHPNGAAYTRKNWTATWTYMP